MRPRRITYKDVVKQIQEVLRNGCTIGELRARMVDVGYDRPWFHFYYNIIYPARKLGLITKIDNKYYLVPNLADCIAWQRPKFYCYPMLGQVLMKTRRYARRMGIPIEWAFIILYPKKVLDVVKGLSEIIKKGGKPDPNIQSMKILGYIKKYGIPDIFGTSKGQTKG
jgi:hypothetical protein